MKGLFDHPISVQLHTYLRLPEYDEHLGLLPVLRDHMKKLCNLCLRGEQRLVVLIDDLDRCQVEKIAEVFDAVRLVMDIPQVTVVMAIDPRIAFMAMEKRYEQLADGNRSKAEVARDYLGKIIHLPIRLIEPQGTTDTERAIGDYVREKLFEGAVPVPQRESRPVEMPGPPQKGTRTPEASRLELVETSPDTSASARGMSDLPADSEPELPEPPQQEPPQPGQSAAEQPPPPPVDPLPLPSPSSPSLEPMHETTGERDLFLGLASTYELSNPRLLLRLRNSYRLLKSYLHRRRGRVSGVPADTDDYGDWMRLLFWLEFLHSMPKTPRHWCMAALLADPTDPENTASLCLKRVETTRWRDIAKRVIADKSRRPKTDNDFRSRVQQARTFVMPHGEDGLLSTRKEIIDWLPTAVRDEK